MVSSVMVSPAAMVLHGSPERRDLAGLVDFLSEFSDQMGEDSLGQTQKDSVVGGAFFGNGTVADCIGMLRFGGVNLVGRVLVEVAGVDDMFSADDLTEEGALQGSEGGACRGRVDVCFLLGQIDIAGGVCTVNKIC